MCEFAAPQMFIRFAVPQALAGWPERTNQKTSLGVQARAGYSRAMAIFTHRASALRLPVFAAAAAGLVLLSGCAGSGSKAKDTAYVAHDVESLYLAAKAKLDENDYRMAAALFDEVERQHPYSPWARRAQVMSAFSYYAARDYSKSVQAAQRFLSIHPGNKDAAYAYYLIAQCYYEQISDVSRDQKDTSQALSALNDVVRRYPDSPYAEPARLQIDLVNDHLGGKEMEIGRFYERSGRWLAADIRFRTVIDKYQATSHTSEALYRLVETSLALGLPDEARKYAAVLGANYPGSEWYGRAYRLMGKDVSEVEPAAAPAPAPAQRHGLMRIFHPRG